MSGANPQVTVQIEHSNDNQNFKDKAATPEINGVTVSTTTIDAAYGNHDGATPLGRFVRFGMKFGASTSGNVDLIVTGRTD